MKAIQWFGPRAMRLVEIEKPAPGPGEALIRVESVGVCGSDMHYFEEGCIGAQRISEPFVLGHEYAGIVEAVGAAADAALEGRRVAVEPGAPCGHCEWCRNGQYNVCRAMLFPGTPPTPGALSEYICAPARCCFPVPEAMSAAEAAMIEPLAVAVHTLELAQMKPGDTVAVLGLGPIGLLTVEMARLCGAGRILGTDLLDYRVAAGRRHGADDTLHAAACDSVEAILERTGGRGADIVFDCAKSRETPRIACKAARPAGRVVLTGISGAEEDLFPVGAARRKELTLQWCRRFKDNFPVSIDLVAKGRVDVKRLITHSFPLEETQEAFELVAGYADNVLKVSIDQ